MSGPSQIVAGDMWSVYHFGDPNGRHQNFLNSRREAVQRFVESLVTHDKVFIPTDDFMSLAIIISIFGKKGVLSLLEQGALGFVRLKGAMAYAGGGAGLKSIQIKNKEGPLKPFCAPMDEALFWALSGIPTECSPIEVTDLAMGATVEVAASVVDDEIRRETLQDIQASEILRSTFNLKTNGIDNLPGIAANSVEIYGGENPHEVPNQIGALLRLAHANLELRLAEEVGASDLSTTCPIGHVLRAKQDLVLGDSSPSKSWATFRKISDLPDIAEPIIADRSQFMKLIKLRQTHDGTEFRVWFHENCRSDPITTGREYAKLLRKMGLMEGVIPRALRFVATSALGLGFGDVTGAVAGAADSFVVERLLRRPSAKIFIERLEQFKPLPADH